MANEPRLLNVSDDTTLETKKGESGTSESIVSTEAKERVEEQTKSSNINQTNVKASVNASSKLLKVSTENQGTRYVRDENNNDGFSRSVGEKKVITNTILVNEVKRLIRELAGENTYSKKQIDKIVRTIREGQYVLVDTTEYPTLESFLASTGEQGTVYLYPVGNEENNYYQYIWEVNNWMSLGTTELDLSGYPTLTGNNTFTEVNRFTKGIRIGSYIIDVVSGNIIKIPTIVQSGSLMPNSINDNNLGYILGGTIWHWRNLYLFNSIRKNNKDYGITIPDMASWTANKELATTDLFANPYASNSTTVLKYETINNISISSNTTFTLKAITGSYYPEYKANITNTDTSNAITITLPSGTKTLNVLTNTIGANTISIGAGETIELTIQNGRAKYINWGS